MRISTLRYRLSDYNHPYYKLKIIDNPLPRIIILDKKNHIAETVKTHEVLTVIYTPDYLHIIKPGGMICMLPINNTDIKNTIKFQKYIPHQYISMNLKRNAGVRIINDYGFEMLYYEDRRYYLCVLESYKQCCDYANLIGFNFNKTDFSVYNHLFSINDIMGYNYSGDTLIIEIYPNKLLLLPLNKQDVQIAEFKSLTMKQDGIVRNSF